VPPKWGHVRHVAGPELACDGLSSRAPLDAWSEASPGERIWAITTTSYLFAAGLRP
jgi:hypothetical protein